jgi:hypothetical protein
VYRGVGALGGLAPELVALLPERRRALLEPPLRRLELRLQRRERLAPRRGLQPQIPLQPATTTSGGCRRDGVGEVKKDEEREREKYETGST